MAHAQESPVVAFVTGSSKEEPRSRCGSPEALHLHPGLPDYPFPALPVQSRGWVAQTAGRTLPAGTPVCVTGPTLRAERRTVRAPTDGHEKQTQRLHGPPTSPRLRPTCPQARLGEAPS
ncbi:hypothetical protein NDU88_007461 [Pleurodeles waltl]|uniref:Uncharacterized protein n=1 Tax=Pleurodeles waltl TaxID=8319 RepID=A0AAV7SSG3_PLEWA|nr:hypothetical protein NDU88_007461 [Pleurodeles waltl]